VGDGDRRAGLIPGRGFVTPGPITPVVEEEFVCLGLNAVAGIDMVLAGSLLVGE